MRVLVTGGSGFIGSHVVERLLTTDPDKLLMLDGWLSEETSRHHDRAEFEFVQGDVRDAALVKDLCGQVDVVFHLASILGTSETIEIYDSEDVADVNVMGTLRVLKASLEAGVQRVVYPATPDVPWLNPYKITKMACEKFCTMFHKEYGLETVVLRLPNVYGPRERWIDCEWGAPYNYQKVVPTFIMNALRNEPLPVFGDGEQKAVYMHVDDIVSALILAAEAEGVGGQVIPIGTREQVSVNQLAQDVIRLTDSSSEPQHLPMRPGEIELDISVDPEIAERALGFVPQMDVESGLRDTIPFYASLVGADVS